MYPLTNFFNKFKPGSESQAKPNVQKFAGSNKRTALIAESGPRQVTNGDLVAKPGYSYYIHAIYLQARNVAANPSAGIKISLTPYGKTETMAIINCGLIPSSDNQSYVQVPEVNVLCEPNTSVNISGDGGYPTAYAYYIYYSVVEA